MTDETQAASVEEDGAPAAIDEAASTEVGAPATPPEGFIPQDRYDNLRADYNRRQALWNRAQQGDIEAMRELNLPVDFGDDEEPEPEDEVLRDPRLDVLLQEREQEKVQRQQQEGWDQFNSDLDKTSKGATLSQDDRLLLYTKTIQSGGNQDALDQVWSGFKKEREAYDKAVIDGYFEAKRNAPFVNPGGTGANEVTDPLDGHARRERLAARIAANQEG